MDIRDIIRSHPDHIVGHSVVADSLNVRDEMKRFNKDPLKNQLMKLDSSDSQLFKGDVGRYLQAFSWYRLCLGRTLNHISVSRRVRSELQWHPQNQKYSARQRLLASKCNELGRYAELDYQNLIIHSCIMLDRTIALSRRFLSGANLPSFTSFNQHKKFLIRNPDVLDDKHTTYTTYITSNTDWFEIPLKALRDKYLMHSSEKHMSFFGWTDSNWDLCMATIIPANKNQAKFFEDVKFIFFTPRRLARDIEMFLLWFAKNI